MSADVFQFSAAAQLYVKYLDAINAVKESKTEGAQRLYQENNVIVTELRAETYQSIANFGNKLLEELAVHPWSDEGLRLCEETSYTVRSYIGGRVHYRWLEPRENEVTPRKAGGWLLLTLPIPEKIASIDNDTKLQGMFFDVIKKHRFGVSIGYDGTDKQKRDRITALTRQPSIGTFVKKEGESWSSMLLSLDPLSPVNSAATKISDLLRAIYEIEHT